MKLTEKCVSFYYVKPAMRQRRVLFNLFSKCPENGVLGYVVGKILGYYFKF